EKINIFINKVRINKIIGFFWLPQFFGIFSMRLRVFNISFILNYIYSNFIKDPVQHRLLLNLELPLHIQLSLLCSIWLPKNLLGIFAYIDLVWHFHLPYISLFLSLLFMDNQFASLLEH
ncbi:hypothetical protein ACJX0J_040669, partial [Zea mays]